MLLYKNKHPPPHKQTQILKENGLQLGSNSEKHIVMDNNHLGFFDMFILWRTLLSHNSWILLSIFLGTD
jgi:hypothetical protein